MSCACLRVVLAGVGTGLGFALEVLRECFLLLRQLFIYRKREQSWGLKRNGGDEKRLGEEYKFIEAEGVISQHELFTAVSVIQF